MIDDRMIDDRMIDRMIDGREREMIMPLEGPLLDILACPIDKQGLLYFADEAVLYNPRLRRLYRIVDGSPVMLADRAEPAAEDEHVRLLKRAGHGEAVGTAGLAVDARLRNSSDTTDGDQYHTSNSYNPR
jgi:uncharacterized protein